MALRFSDFSEFVLARLYDLDNGEFIDVNELAAELLEPVPQSWPYDAVSLLDERGLVLEAMGFGKPDAMITGAGRIFVEEQERISSSIVHAYRAQPSNFVVVLGSGNQVVVDSQDVEQTKDD